MCVCVCVCVWVCVSVCVCESVCAGLLRLVSTKVGIKLEIVFTRGKKDKKRVEMAEEIKGEKK